MLSLFARSSFPEKPLTEPTYSPISSGISDDTCYEIFLRVASNFEEANLKRLGLCHLTSKNSYKVIEPIWRLIKKETGMNISWQVFRDTAFPQAYDLLLNRQIYQLIHNVFQTDSHRLPRNNLPVEYLQNLILRNCEFLIRKSTSLSNKFNVIMGSSFLYSLWIKIKRSTSNIFSKEIDVGEQILQVFVDAKQSNGQINEANLNKIITKENPDIYPFLFKILLSSNRSLSPAKDLLLIKGADLWKSGQKDYLEIMLEHLWKEKNHQPNDLEIVLDTFCKNFKKHVAPVTFIVAAANINVLYERAFSDSNYIFIKSSSTKDLLAEIQGNNFSKRLLNLVVNLMHKSIIDPLDEDSPITDLFLPFLLKMDSTPTEVLLFNTKQKIRSENYHQALVQFKNYLGLKYGVNYDDAEIRIQAKMSKDELEILHFLQLKLIHGRDISRAYYGYLALANKSKEKPISLKLHIRYNLALMEAALKLGKFKEAEIKLKYLCEYYNDEMSPKQQDFHDIAEEICKIFDQKNQSIDFSKLNELIQEYPKTFSLIIQIFINIPFNEKYISQFHEFFKEGILSIKADEKIVEEILEGLLHFDSPWLKEIKIHQLLPLSNLLGPALNIFNRKVENEGLNLSFPSKIITMKKKGNVSPEKLFLSLMNHILEIDTIELYENTVADGFLPLLLIINPQDPEILRLQARQKIRSGKIDEGLDLYEQYIKLKPEHQTLVGDFILCVEFCIQRVGDCESAYNLLKSIMIDYKPILEKNRQNFLRVSKMFVQAAALTLYTKYELNKIEKAKEICYEITKIAPPELIDEDGNIVLNKIINIITKKYEPISTYLFDDTCFEIFRQVAGNFEKDNLNKLAMCQLTSRKVYPLIKPIWQLVRKKTGMNVTWQVCQNTMYPETYNWMLNQRLFLLLKFIFNNSHFKPLSFYRKFATNVFKDCEFSLKKSHFLTKSFHIIARQEPVVFPNWEKLKEKVFKLIFIKNDTNGEKILQMFVDAMYGTDALKNS